MQTGATDILDREIDDEENPEVEEARNEKEVRRNFEDEDEEEDEERADYDDEEDEDDEEDDEEDTGRPKKKLKVRGTLHSCHHIPKCYV